MAALMSALLLAAGAVSAHAATPGPEARYQALLAVAKAGKPVDWRALRYAYADRPSFNVLGDGLDPLRKQMFDAMQANDFAGAITAAQQVIDKDFVDADAHLIVFLSDVKLGQREEGFRDRDIGLGLIVSMQTGDGKTPATALTVINVAEEYSYLRAVNLRPSSQSLIHDGGHSYDVLNAVDQAGQTQSVYFLIDRVVADEAKALAPKTPAPSKARKK
jgi:hypothetical protein